jgi:hypothetical protein
MIKTKARELVSKMSDFKPKRLWGQDENSKPENQWIVGISIRADISENETRNFLFGEMGEFSTVERDRILREFIDHYFFWFISNNYHLSQKTIFSIAKYCVQAIDNWEDLEISDKSIENDLDVLMRTCELLIDNYLKVR